MFESATAKLTGWYLIILMVISLLFSIVIYQIATTEVSHRLQGFEDQITIEPSLQRSFDDGLRGIRRSLMQEATVNIVWTLMYFNVFILCAGGIGSYFLARRTLEPLKRAHQAQERFTSDASHELRTPLAAMKMELEVALRDPKLQKTEMRELLESNLEEVNKLTDLSTTLLKISRNDHQNLVFDTFKLATAIRAVPKRTAEANRFVIKKPLPDITLTANRSSIEEIMLILCDNALKYSSPKTKVRISAKKRAGRALIHITNRGPGITKEHIHRIFDRFYRGDTSRTNSGNNGFGLGLSLAKQLAQLHGGEINAVSTPGKTTTFTISLPIR